MKIARVRLKKKREDTSKKSTFNIENLSLSDNKTRNLKKILMDLDLKEKILIVTDDINENLRLASRNLPDVRVLSFRSLNIYEMMRHKKIVFAKDAILCRADGDTKRFLRKVEQPIKNFLAQQGIID